MARDPILWSSSFGEVEAALDSARAPLRRYWAGHLALLPEGRRINDVKIADTPEDRNCAKIVRAALRSFGLPLVVEDEPCPAAVLGPCFVVDPLDGTHNAMMGYPAFTISVALFDSAGQVEFGWVYDLSRDVAYLGARGLGSFVRTPLAARRLTTERQKGIQNLAVSMMRHRSSPQGIGKLMREARKVRISACSSLDLCLVAAGALDAFIDVTEPGHERTCDIAAAAVVLSEAGGILLDPAGSPRKLAPPGAAALHDYGGLVAIGDPDCAESLLETLQEGSHTCPTTARG